MKESKNYICSDARGLTITNAALLVKLVNQSDCNVSIGVNGNFCSAGNILDILCLKITFGDFVTIIAEGLDAPEVVESIGDLLCRSSSPGMCLPSYG